MNIAAVYDEKVIKEQIYGFVKKRNSDFNISFFYGEKLFAAGAEPKNPEKAKYLEKDMAAPKVTGFDIKA